ncbi:MAG: class I SAM-dependent methyltransferase [Deltaproteobacteria bacterium]|nr:class I SAM-dependent methyltransferase [Deltaproteobacteria bacterium]
MKSARQALSPSPWSMKAIKDSAVDLVPEDQSLLDWHREYISIHSLRLAFDLDIVKMYVAREADVLELGSIPLFFTNALSKSNYYVTGCDIAPERYASSISRLGMAVVKCDIETEKLPFGNNSFDAIIFNEIFEHLRINPIFTLSEVLRVMKPKALLVLSSPNLRSLKGIINILFKGRAHSCCGNIYAEYRKLETLGHMGHVREYTEMEVVEFLENIGFSVTEVIYRGQYENRTGRLIVRMMPHLSPFITYLAHKPEQGAVHL